MRDQGTLKTLLPATLSVAWFAFIAVSLYDFRSAGALAWLRTGLPYFGAVLAHVPRNIAALPEALLLLFSGWGVGDLLCSRLRLEFRSVASRLASALCVGLICWTFAVMLAGATQHLGGRALPAILALGAAFSAVRLFGMRRGWRALRVPETPHDRWSWFVAIAALALLVAALYFALLGALQPEIEFDAKVFHLAMAKRYVEHGGFYNVGAAEGLPSLDFPQYQEYLYTAGYGLFGMIGAKMLSWSMLLIAAIAIVGFAAEFFGSTLVGLFAALLFAATPIVSWSATTANTDLAQVPFFLLALYGVLRWRERSVQPAWLLFAGLLCGYAIGIKPFALASCLVLGIVIAVAAVRLRTLKPLAYFAAGAVATALPSLVRTGMLTGDPLFPLAAGLLHSPLWSPKLDALIHSAYTLYGASRSWYAFPLLPWLLTMRADQYRDVVGPVYLFALPFIGIYTFRKDAHPLFRLLGVLLLGWCLLWFMATAVVGFAIEVRYAEMLLPLLALAIAYVALSPRVSTVFGVYAQRLFTALLLAMTLLNQQPFVEFQRNALLPYVMGAVRYQWDYLYGCEPRSNVQLRYAPMLAWMNAHLNAHRDRVYTDTGDYLLNLYSDVELVAGDSQWNRDVNAWTLESPNAYELLRERHIDYVLVGEGKAHQLAAAPLFGHLQAVANGPSIDPAETEVLYRVTAPKRRRGT
ncbi:MAG: ArnT family glycosyltransferase [Steroidobacteraceae bacterium]